jgi:hypothetical protein
MNKDQQWMSSSYVVSFFQNVGVLTSLYSEYVTMSIEFKDRGDLSDGETSYFQKLIRDIKILSTTIFIQYESISLSVKNNDNNVSIHYSSLLESAVLSNDIFKKYVLSLNTFLVGSVISELFDKSQDFLNNISSNQGKT